MGKLEVKLNEVGVNLDELRVKLSEFEVKLVNSGGNWAILGYN